MNAPEKVGLTNLMQRINQVRAAVGYVKKDKSVSTGGGSYRAVTHDMVTAMVRQYMIDQGIVCVPNLVASSMNSPIGESKQWRYEATYDFAFINADNPEDKITIRIESHAMDNADKAPGKAISYAKKYAILKLFEIETGDDEESRVPDVQATSREEDDVLAKYQEAALLGIASLKAFHSITKGPVARRVWEKHGTELKATANEVSA